jgi:hypothetical protein
VQAPEVTERGGTDDKHMLLSRRLASKSSKLTHTNAMRRLFPSCSPKPCADCCLYPLHQPYRRPNRPPETHTATGIPSAIPKTPQTCTAWRADANTPPAVVQATTIIGLLEIHRPTVPILSIPTPSSSSVHHASPPPRQEIVERLQC